MGGQLITRTHVLTRHCGSNNMMNTRRSRARPMAKPKALDKPWDKYPFEGPASPTAEELQRMRADVSMLRERLRRMHGRDETFPTDAECVATQLTLAQSNASPAADHSRRGHRRCLSSESNDSNDSQA